MAIKYYRRGSGDGSLCYPVERRSIDDPVQYMSLVIYFVYTQSSRCGCTRMNRMSSIIHRAQSPIRIRFARRKRRSAASRCV